MVQSKYRKIVMCTLFMLGKLLNFTLLSLQEPCDHQTKDLGSVVKLSTDHLFITTASSEQLKYQWSRITNEGEEKIEDEECFKNSDSKTMVIDGFENKSTGTYRCVISTSNQLEVLMSVEVELDLPGKHNIILQNNNYNISYFLQILLKILAII